MRTAFDAFYERNFFFHPSIVVDSAGDKRTKKNNKKRE